MDPDVTLASLVGHLRSGLEASTYDEYVRHSILAADDAAYLIEWLAAGGFAPDWSRVVTPVDRAIPA